MNSVQTVSTSKTIDPEVLAKLMISGDLSGLNAEQKVVYYHKFCEALGLNPLSKPMEYMRLNGKEVLYATKGCAEQLRQIYKISLKIVARDKIDDVYVVTAEASQPGGRIDSSTGVVSLSGLKGETLANAMMKAETKAKRRVTLSICGLNMLDETEVETIRGVRPEQPGPNDGDPNQIQPWKFTFGQWNGKTLEQVYNDPKYGPKHMAEWCDWIVENNKEKGTQPNPRAQEAIEAIENFLGAMENREPGAEG